MEERFDYCYPWFFYSNFLFLKKLVKSSYIVIIYKSEIVFCVLFKIILKWLLQVIIFLVVFLLCCNYIGNIFDNKFLSHFLFFCFCCFSAILMQVESVFKRLALGLAVQLNCIPFLRRLIQLVFFMYIIVFWFVHQSLLVLLLGVI